MGDKMEGVTPTGGAVDPSKYGVPIETYVPPILVAFLLTSPQHLRELLTELQHALTLHSVAHANVLGQQPRGAHQDRDAEGGAHRRVQTLWHHPRYHR